MDLILKRILTVVGDERCENHLGLKGKGSFSMYIKEGLVIPNHSPNWNFMGKVNRLIFLYYLNN